jgi:hypothetical protein
VVSHNSWYPLKEIEEHLQKIQENINNTPPLINGNPPSESKLWDAKIGIMHILMNIRERVETFIAEVESPHSESAQTVQIVRQESPINKAAKNLHWPRPLLCVAGPKGPPPGSTRSSDRRI